MGYYIDLNAISIDSYKVKLKKSDMLPSRMILKERIDECFDYFKSIGITNLMELQSVLRKKDKLTTLSKVKCLAGEYLVILLREINSINPKPNKIKELKGITSLTVSKLKKIGIIDTVRLFEKVKNPKSRAELSKVTGISNSDILELTKLTDLSRIKWVGVSFARMLYDAGIDTVEKTSKADFEDVHKRINQINKEKNYYKGQIGLNDMRLFVNAAKDVSLDIVY